MGQNLVISQTLPKAKGTFQRGCVDRFTIYSDGGDMGQLLALKVGRFTIYSNGGDMGQLLAL